MPLSRRALLALTAAVLVPGLPASGAVAVTPLVRQTALRLGRTAAAVGAEQLLGVTWSGGDARVQARWRSAAGWGAWGAAEQDVEAGERRRGTEPLWPPRGASAVELQVAGAPIGLALVRVTDGQPRSHSASGGERHPLLGLVHRRADWGADESKRRDRPDYAATIDAVVVHHTAGSNDYTEADVPRRIRADYAYHVDVRGWSDLGYNLVVDRYGGIWEGRAGGLGRATIGAHAAGFNTATLGVSLLGDMTRERPTEPAVRAFARITAYAAATWRFDPRSAVTLTSRGGPRYAAGTRVRLPRVFGHTDVGRTACPGALMDRLDDIRAGAVALLGPAPRLLDVKVSGAPVHAPEPVVIAGRLNRSAPWTAALRDSDGAVVARSAGESASPRLEWNGLRPVPGTEAGGQVPALVPAAAGTYRWSIAVDNGYHPAARREDDIEVALPIVPAGS
ncbi:MAG: N-acetylmuramoyl-L-alanine amidase [Frankiales bacterium]|nr:N-acetylmuramoyl-L-alanine amidase [Frankiales bacterium]